MGNENTADFKQLQPAPVFKQIKKLQLGRGYRDKVKAVDHDFPVETIIYSEKLLTSPVARKLVRRMKRRGTPFVSISPDEYRRISVTERASGVAAIFRQLALELGKLDPTDVICWTAVSHLRSPGNFGTLIRTSAAVGARGFILIGEDIVSRKRANRTDRRRKIALRPARPDPNAAQDRFPERRRCRKPPAL